MLTADLTGPDLLYWVARANSAGSAQEKNVVRRHYGNGPGRHLPSDEPAMRAFVASKLGNELPARDAWY